MLTSEGPAPTTATVAGHGTHGRLSPALVLGAIGIVFGDIGTSPLYTFQACLAEGVGAPRGDSAEILGITSLIVWSITLVVTIKYLQFLMRADNHGEGGIMALLALVPTRITRGRPGTVGAVALLVIAGASLLFGDGVITPAISVLSAVEGLGVATPTLRPVVVPITVAILVALFAVQRRGTGGLGALFGPVMVVWFATIGALGAYHLSTNPSILTALSPHHGYLFFAHHGWKGFKVLGGVVLAVTGGEALYADMGHFGRQPIRVAWLALVFPALVLCYLGEAAHLLAHPEAAADPFYGMIGAGSPYIYPMVGLAAAATVIASQALISGVFSLTHQAIQLGFFPRVEVRHTSRTAEGQIYVPLLNAGLALACIALVLAFRASSGLAAAYGLAVSGTMLITSIVYYLVGRYTWGWSGLAAGALLAFFLSFDVPFVVANSLKFLDGGYLPFSVGALFTLVMVSWRAGRSLLAEFLANEPPFAEYLDEVDRLCGARVPGTMVVMNSNPSQTPPVLARMVQRFRAVYQHTLVVTVVIEHQPWVDEAERVSVVDAGHGFLRVAARYGFMEEPNVPVVVGRVLEDKHLDWGGDPSKVVYALGRETLIVTSKGRMGPVTEPVFAFLSRNARSATEYFAIPPEQVVELGVQVDL